MSEGDHDAFNALESHSDGTVSVRSGFVPIVVGGYELPSRDEADKIANRDVYKMGVDECMAELDRISAAMDAREKLRAEGVRDIIILKKTGAESFEDWAAWRVESIRKRALYGR